ncbi:hypothetical protein SAMN05216266_111123 [Amycolatopsis marina]|uniref:Uncharacterized protein n=1 Tax=Amycolatopsis marina TaxID=490629 RepID=A0A1I1B1N9_9PSEU|nr:hypothetical protein [Amycolatopsis marina]SFB43712.1 hypothetical protein SAMN05216266_111123 [Amycolatopsis marina]
MPEEDTSVHSPTANASRADTVNTSTECPGHPGTTHADNPGPSDVPCTAGRAFVPEGDPGNGAHVTTAFGVTASVTAARGADSSSGVPTTR